MDKKILNAERSEQVLWSGLYNAASASAREQFGLSVHSYLDADCVMASNIPSWFMNRVIGLGLEQPVKESDIDQLISLYNGNGAPIGISLCPEAQTTEIEDWLSGRGFTIANEWFKMVRDTRPPKEISCDLRLEVADSDLSDVVAEITGKGFDMEFLIPLFTVSTEIEGNHVYLAWDGDTPAAVASLTVVGDVGHINTAATLPEYRGRGAQGALMARRIEDGVKLGCKQFVTETWVPAEGEVNHSYNNMLRHGFELLYKRKNWQLPVAE